MNAFKEVAEIIGWLAGAVAAFSGVVYVAGYLIVQTTRHLLGFDRLLTYSTDFYLQKGGAFLLDVGITTAQIVLAIILVLGLVLFVSLLFSVPVASVFYPFKRRHVKDAIYRTRTRWIRMTKRTPWVWVRPVFWLLLLRKRLSKKAKRRSWVWRGLVFSVLVFFLFWVSFPQLQWVQATIEIKNLDAVGLTKYNENPDNQCRKAGAYKRCLMTNRNKANGFLELSWMTKNKDPDTECKETKEYRKCQVKTRLVKRDEDNTRWLGSQFEDILIATLVSGLLLFFAWRTVSPWRFRYLLTLPFMLMFITLFTLLPMVYGVLKDPMEFSPIEIRFLTENPSHESGNLFFLNMTGEEFILWNADNRETLVVPKESVLAAEIKQPRFLFDKKVPAGGN